MTRIIIADDHEVVRAGIRRVLDAQPDWEVVGEAENGLQAVELALREQPHVAILDYGLPACNGVEAAKQIHSKLPKTEILIFTMHDHEDLVRDVLAAGARGYLLKSDANRLLVDAVRSLEMHKPYFTSKISQALLSAYLAKKETSETTLTSRERSVVQLIAEGHTNKEIAAVLNISPKTVEAHRAAIMRKLDLSSAAALVRYAVRHRLVD